MRDVRFWRKSIKTKLILILVLLCTVPAVLVGYFAFENGKRALEEDVTRHLTSVAALKSQELGQWFEEQAEDVTDMAISPYLVENCGSLVSEGREPLPVNPSHQRVKAFLDKYVEDDDFLEFFIMNLDGEIVVSTDEDQQGKFKANRSYFQYGKTDTFIQNVYHSLTLGGPAVTISTPIRDEDGHAIRVLAGRLNLATLNEIMGEYTGLHETGDTYLVNKYNFFVTEPRGKTGYALKKAIHTKAVKQCLEGNSGTGLYEDYRGVPVVGAYTWIEERELGLFAEVDQADAFAPIRSLQKTMILIFALVITATIAVGLFLAAGFTRPIRRLAVAAAAIGKGDFSQKIAPTAEDELGQLAKSFDRMVDELQRTTVSRDYLENILANMIDILIIFDPNGLVRSVNKATCDLTGYTADELVGSSIGILFSGADETLLKRGRLTSYELKLRGKSGDTVPALVNVSPIRDKDGSIASMVCTAKDITELQQAEKEVRESEARYRNIFENTGAATVIIEEDTTLSLVNSEFEKLSGWSKTEVEGKKSFTEFVVEEELGRLREYHRRRRTAANLAPQNYETRFRDRWGNIRDILVTASLIPGTTKSVASLLDMTEHKHSEENGRRLQQELYLSSRLASIGQMASGIAHEINNPLTSVIGFSQLLLRQQIPDNVRKRLEVINREAQRVAKIVENLLTFARRYKPGRECTDIDDILSQTLELRAYEMKANNIRVVTDLSPDLPHTMGDPGQLQQVFLNIILNAEKVMIEAHGGGTLQVKTEKVRNRIKISFADDGPGISKENLDKIFDPFFTTREVGNGTGLGLSICHGIVAQHKGRLRVESELGKGATFTVELPIVAQTESEDSNQKSGEDTHSQTGATILVIDDEHSVLDFLDSLLTEEGYRVETADSADAALKSLQSKVFDLILLDIKMPRKSGIELYREIEAEYPLLVKKVIFITGDIMEPTTLKFLSKKKRPYLTKPIKIEELLEKINRMLTGGE